MDAPGADLAVANGVAGGGLLAGSTPASNAQQLLLFPSSNGTQGLSIVNNEIASKKRQRERLFEEIIETERIFVDDLGVLLSVFYIPLRVSAADDSGGNNSNGRTSGGRPLSSTSNSASSSSTSLPPSPRGILSEEDINTIFSNVSDLMRLNMELLRKMELQLSIAGIDKAAAFAEAFKELKEVFKLYSIYAISYPQAIAVLQKCEETNPNILSSFVHC
jgi:hypothetical protein